jgi:uncharacterized protein
MGMNRTFKAAVAALMLAVSFAGSAAAGPFEDAVVAHDKDDYATALRLLRPLAVQGFANAQFYLGHMYENGRGGRETTRLRWFGIARQPSKDSPWLN